MKILITGDVHKNFALLDKIIEKESPFDLHLNTGDLEGNSQILQKYQNMVIVKGNCDYNQELEYQKIIVKDGLKIFLTHGHLFNVKLGINELIDHASSHHVDLCIFGHTHQPFYRKIYNMTVINPGSLSNLGIKTYVVYQEGKVSFIDVN